MGETVRPFSSVLVANRGEIALRVIRACREMGLKSVAVFTDPDRDAPHAREADEALPLGDAAGYLDPGKLLGAARKAKAGALHPGYGFLSERAGFAEAVEGAGLTWIGPPPSAMRIVGNKIAARRLAAKAGVPVLPEGKGAGYPLLVKAAAGGGGRGQRVVRAAKGLDEAVAAARREAKASFGSDQVFLERYLERPRHVEVQILGDVKGNVLHLYERECSVQRRHQKLIEESPSPALDGKLRGRLCAAAVKLVKAAGYMNAGTVEFLLDGPGGDFFFLEVNARLQVEHPVTEMTTGIDLAQAQLRIAMGEPLPFGPGDVRPRGHAIEARICAEDPDRDFLPSGGDILALELPAAPGVRWDTALEIGQRVGTDYDSLLGKCIAVAEDRPRAIRRLDEALRQSVILGLRHNVGFLRAVLHSRPFAAGGYATDLVPSILPGWAARGRKLPKEALEAAARATGPARRASGSPDPWDAR